MKKYLETNQKQSIGMNMKINKSVMLQQLAISLLLILCEP